MTWFKVDDKLHDHRKARAAGKSAMGVWVLAGSWSADNLTDGFVPVALLSRWGTRADANKLVAVGLWHVDEQDGEKGWRFHEWTERQPTRSQKLAERAARAEAGRLGGQASGRSRGQAKSKQSASGLVEPPARPDPTAAAAAAFGALGLPVPLKILQSKLQAHTPLRGLRFDSLSDDQVTRLVGLLEVHGDEPLVAVAVATCRNPAPTSAAAFLGTWEALPPPGQRLGVVRQRLCDTHQTVLSPSGTCNACASEQIASDR